LQIIHSNDVLFFYVGRRYQTINIARLAVPYNFTNLPMTVTGWEALNSYPIYAPRSMQIMNDTYQLRSAVIVEKTNVSDGNRNRDLITGSSALICCGGEAFGDDSCISYDPQGVGAYKPNTAGVKYERQAPIKPIPSQPMFTNGTNTLESFDQKTTNRGTIFMYAKTTDNANHLFADRGMNFI
jgi:hypothetical protein